MANEEDEVVAFGMTDSQVDNALEEKAHSITINISHLEYPSDNHPKIAEVIS